MDEFAIHPRIAEELLSPTPKPKLDVYNDTVYLILHFPTTQHAHAGDRNQEVDFIIGKNYLITVHYNTINSIQAFTKEFEVYTTVHINKKGDLPHAGFIFYNLIRSFYRGVQNELDVIESQLAVIEDSVFEGKERKMVIELSKVSRSLLDMEQTIEGHERALKDLLGETERMFGKSFIRELQDILHDYHTVYYRIKDEREFLNELRTANDSLLSTKQNEVMKTLTILAFVTFPLSLVAGIFGMNTKLLPLVGLPGDFWIIISIMILLAAFMFMYFKHNRWL